MVSTVEYYMVSTVDWLDWLKRPVNCKGPPLRAFKHSIWYHNIISLVKISKKTNSLSHTKYRSGRVHHPRPLFSGLWDLQSCLGIGSYDDWCVLSMIKTYTLKTLLGTHWIKKSRVSTETRVSTSGDWRNLKTFSQFCNMTGLNLRPGLMLTRPIIPVLRGIHLEWQCIKGWGSGAKFLKTIFMVDQKGPLVDQLFGPFDASVMATPIFQPTKRIFQRSIKIIISHH